MYIERERERERERDRERQREHLWSEVQALFHAARAAENQRPHHSKGGDMISPEGRQAHRWPRKRENQRVRDRTRGRGRRKREAGRERGREGERLGETSR